MTINIETIRFGDNEENPELQEAISEDEEVLAQLEKAEGLMEEADGLMIQSKDYAGRAEEIKLQAAEILSPIHTAYGIRGVKTDRGNMTFYYGTNSKLDKPKLQKLLVTAGVKLNVVVDSIKKATKTTTNKKLTLKYEPVIED